MVDAALQSSSGSGFIGYFKDSIFCPRKELVNQWFYCTLTLFFRSDLLKPSSLLSSRNMAEIFFVASAAITPSALSGPMDLTSSANYRLACTQHPMTIRPSRFFSKEKNMRSVNPAALVFNPELYEHLLTLQSHHPQRYASLRQSSQ